MRSADPVAPRARTRALLEGAPEARTDRARSLPKPEPERQDDDHEGKAPRGGFLRRHPVRAAIGAASLLLVAGAGYVYWDYASHFESTDDAFIAARQFAIAPKVPGYLVEVPVTDNQ